MILALPLLTGAFLASGSKNVGEAAALGLVSHYFLDSIPHIEYKAERIREGKIKSAAKEFVKISIDLMVGAVIVFYFLQNKSFDQSILILSGAFFGILPDGLSFLDYCVKDKDKNFFFKFLKNHGKFHRKIHSNITAKAVNISCQLIIIFLLIYIISN